MCIYTFCRTSRRLITIYTVSGVLTDYDVISHDLHVVVAIGPGVFVPEPDHVSELVHDDAELVAVLSDGYRLWTVAALADKRTASGKRVGKKNRLG